MIPVVVRYDFKSIATLLSLPECHYVHLKHIDLLTTAENTGFVIFFQINFVVGIYNQFSTTIQCTMYV